jgi:hypothetical protein
MRKKLIVELQALIDDLPETAKNKLFVRTLTPRTKRIKGEIFFSNLSRTQSDKHIYDYLKQFSPFPNRIKFAFKRLKLTGELPDLIINKIDEIQQVQSFDDAQQFEGETMPKPNASGFINTATNTKTPQEEVVILGSTDDATAAEQPKSTPSVNVHNSFFKAPEYMTGFTVKLVATSLSLLAGTALAVFLALSGTASIALIALAAALLIVGTVCGLVLMKEQFCSEKTLAV